MKEATVLKSKKSFSLVQWFLTALLIAGIFLRFYNLPNTVIFQADQARDSLLVNKMFLQHKPVFIGPVTSVGNMYLGPLYYYLMLPFLAVSYPSPLGPVVAVATTSVLTIYLFYALGKHFLGEQAGIIAAFLATFSSLLIYFARFSWNPNPIPLFSLLLVYFTYMAWKVRSKYWIAVSICFSVLLQLHYIALILLGGAGFFWLLSLITIFRQKKDEKQILLKNFVLNTVASVLILAFSFVPLIIFDLRHQFLNLKAFQSIFVTEKILSDHSENKLSDVLFGIIRESHGRSIEVLFVILVGKVTQVQNILLAISGIALLWFFKFRKKIQNWDGKFLLIVFSLINIIGLSAYKRSLFDHYLLFAVPVTIWLIASFFAELSFSKVGKALLVLLGVGYIYINAQTWPLKSQGWTLDKVKEVSNEAAKHLHYGEQYDVVLLSESGDFSGLNYRYYLSTSNTPPIDFDSSENTNTLVIINENQKNKETSTIAAYKIQVFGKPKEIVKILRTEGPNIEIWRK